MNILLWTVADKYTVIALYGVKLKEQLKDKTLLIDGDILVYRCGFASEKAQYLVQEELDEDDQFSFFENHKVANSHIKQIPKGRKNWLWSRKDLEPIENCLQIVKSAMEGIVGGSKYEVYLSGGVNFRYGIAKTKAYKANRGPKPTYYKDIQNYLVSNWGATYTDGIEADDIIGIRASELGTHGCIVSTDKDLEQIAGWHFNWVDGRVYRVSPREGAFNFYRQLLTGDSTDNVPGLEGVGEKGANKILEGAQNTQELFERTWTAYRDRVGDEAKAIEYMREQAGLLWIQRKGEETWNMPSLPGSE